MGLKIIRKILASSIIGSMLMAGVASFCVSAGDDGKNLASNDADHHQENQEDLFLQEHDIPKAEYEEFLNLSGLDFDQTRYVLETDPDVNFAYIYKLSEITKNHWAWYKQENLHKSDIFFQALCVAKALHLEYNNVDYLGKLLEANLISLHDVDIFVEKGFSDEQKQNLSVEDLAGRISKMAAETYTDFFRNDFKFAGYSGYGACANVMQLTGLTFDQIQGHLKCNAGICALERIAKCCEDDPNLLFSDVVEKFENCDKIKADDVFYLYREIVSKLGFNFSDMLEVFDQFKGLTAQDLVKTARSAKKSNRTLLAEFQHKDN